MTKIISFVAASIFITGSALAADLGFQKGQSLYSQPSPPPMWWGGFYVGLNAGGILTNGQGQNIGVTPIATGLGFPHNPLFGNPSIDTGSFLTAFASAASASGFNSGSNAGFIGGGQFGYNYNIANKMIVGFETDFQGIAAGSPSRTVATSVPVAPDVNGRPTNYVGIHSVHESLNYLGTVRGRLGWRIMPSLLVYGTGGMAYGGANIQTQSLVYNDFYAFQASLNTPGVTHIPATAGGVNNKGAKVGWTAGGGLEWMLSPNWSAKLEYLYYDLGTIQQNYVMVQTDNETALNAYFGGQVRTRVTGNMARVGLNYHLYWGPSTSIAPRRYGF